MKPNQKLQTVEALCRSSLWRGAWIETLPCSASSARKSVAPLYGEGRGLKHLVLDRAQACGIVAPLYGEGRGLKLGIAQDTYDASDVAPLYGEGRGLKLAIPKESEIGRQVAPLYGEGRGLKHSPLDLPRKNDRRSSLWRGAWIETA